MFLDPEGGRLKSLDVVTGGALALICPLHELAVVLVLVAVQAALKGEWLLEIAAAMTPQAIDRLMLAFQRILGFSVIETLVDGFQRNPFPSGGVMARLAALLRKTAVMWIRVAIRAAVECQAHVARLVIRSGRMTLGAGHLRMQAAQRIARLVVVELRDIFPVFEVMALLAVLSQPATMLIFVAIHASRRHAQKSPRLIANLDGEQFGARDVLRRVAAITGEARVFAGQVVTGLRVIESGGRRCPFHDRKIFAIVLGVTARALLTGVCL